MYTRRLLPQRDEPVEAGKPIQGTWTSPFEKVDLLAVDRPYRILFPAWILDFRLKEWQAFTVQDDHILMEVIIANMKFFCFAEVVFFNKQSKEKMHVFKTRPFSAWRMPQSLNNAVIDQACGGFSFCIHNCFVSRKVTLKLSIDSAIERPLFRADFVFDLDLKKSTPLAVNLFIAENRSMYILKNFSGIEGNIIWGDSAMTLHEESAGGLFRDCKGFIPYHSNYINCRAFGFDAGGRRFGFSLGENIARKLNVNNENALWLDGTLTPLPPVRITGAEHGEFVIQDIEGMVDLNFKLTEDTNTPLDLLFISMERSCSIGLFNGMVMTQKGEKLTVRNVMGILENFKFKL
ncbi:MAG: DUF2804 domain-containing protein [Spirochaetaceae bacterium]|jgi:hypothetical protein|nr:DUF2804 domain-containing protein [Spirochaetaceae bacterium]